MTNLIIIGNGFDMAHGLNTSYSNFIEFLIDNKFNDKSLYSDLFEFTSTTIVRYKSYENIINNKTYSHRADLFETDNLFFKRLTNNLFNYNWCDIERQYFTELSNIGKDARYKSAKALNSDFEIVKKYLSEYLKLEQSNFEQIWAYEQYFEKITIERNMVLNFNYTNTVSNYLRGTNSELVQIHGVLENQENPIIFGYAADDNESRELLKFEDKEFMRNIKKHNYKRTKEENRLIDFLNLHQNIEVSVIGHSCGLSDKLILNQIFNNKNVSDIRLYFHKDHEHYFETQVNIDRIMNNDTNFRKLINFQDSIQIPQKDNQKDYQVFSEKTDLLIKLYKEKDKKRGPHVF